jgi:hypothetical protein
MKKILGLLVFLFISVTCRGAEFSVGYDSKYVSEGRDNLDRGGILWTTLNADIDSHFSFQGAYGRATDSSVDYDELNLGMQFADSVGEVDYYFGYTYLSFFEDDQDDHEIGFGFVWNSFGAFTPFLDYVHSTSASGSFLQLGIQTETKIGEALIINPYLSVAYDFGYASESHDGHNHVALGASLNYRIDDAFSMKLLLEQTFGGSDVRNENGQNNQFWTGLHLNYSF